MAIDLDGFDLPPGRMELTIDNVRWLLRNSDHPRLVAVVAQLRALEKLHRIGAA